MLPIALTIAGSDPGGGAGIQADLKTFHQLRVYGASAITLITVQNTTRTTRVHALEPDLVGQQIDAVLEDLPPRAVKTGALGNAAIIEAVAARSFPCPLIIDPAAVSKHGMPLLDEDGIRALRRVLLPKAALITPNLPEAATLAGITVETPEQMKEAALRISGMGAAAVLIKGGHLNNESYRYTAYDLLCLQNQLIDIARPRVPTRHTHGTGCTYSAAIAAFMARGYDMPEAVLRAREFVMEAIRTNPGLGAGSGPLNHWAAEAP